MAYDHNTDTDNSMHAAFGAHADSVHPVQVADSSADLGRTGSLPGAGGISPQSNYNGPEAWSGQAGPKLQDPRPSGNSSKPTFGKRNIYGS